MNTHPILSESTLLALGWTLLHALWQGFALVLPVAVTLHWLRRRDSRGRYALGVGTLLMQVLLSVVTFNWYYQPTLALPVATPSLQTLLVQAHYPALHVALPWYVQMQQFLNAHLTEIVVCWAIGVCVFLVRLVGGWLYIQQLKTTAFTPTTRVWAEPLAKLREKLAIQTAVQVRESARVAMPVVIGAIRPVLLLPIGLATGLSLRELEAVLAHELAHIKRHDYAVNLLQSVVEVVYFFHPALWWLSARVREERENCCDDLAVQACGDARALAAALARVEEFSQAQPVLAMAFASRREQLLNRVRRMLGMAGGPVVSNAHLALLTVATVLLVSVSVYAVQRHEDTPKKSRLTKQVSTHKPTELRLIPAQFSILNERQITGEVELADSIKTPTGWVKSDVIALKSLRNMLDSMQKADPSFSWQSISVKQDTTINGVVVNSRVDMKNNADRDRQQAVHQRQIDSLNQIMAQKQVKISAIQSQIERMRFPTEEMERKMEVLNWRKDKLMQQRDALLEKHRQLLYGNDGKIKRSTVETEKQLEALEPEIKKFETGAEELTKEMDAYKEKQLQARQPMEKLEREARQLEEEMGHLSEQMGKHGEEMGHLSEDMAELSDLDVMIAPERPRHIRGSVRVPRLARPPRPNVLVTPPAPPVSPPAPAIAPRPVPAPRSVITPKAATAPKPR